MSLSAGFAPGAGRLTAQFSPAPDVEGLVDRFVDHVHLGAVWEGLL